MNIDFVSLRDRRALCVVGVVSLWIWLIDGDGLARVAPENADQMLQGLRQIAHPFVTAPAQRNVLGHIVNLPLRGTERENQLPFSVGHGLLRRVSRAGRWRSEAGDPACSAELPRRWDMQPPRPCGSAFGSRLRGYRDRGPTVGSACPDVEVHLAQPARRPVSECWVIVQDPQRNQQVVPGRRAVEQ